jgi:hypothetical protein
MIHSKAESEEKKMRSVTIVLASRRYAAHKKQGY